MKLQERIYETVDGRLVREGDPAGAFLAYGIGDEPGSDKVDELKRLLSPTGVTSQAYTDDEARDALRVRQADPTRENRAVAAAVVADDPTAPVLMHDRLATELADEARERANRNASLADEDTDEVTTKRLYRTADGDLVQEGDERAVTLAYGPGDKIKRGDLDAFDSLSDEDEKQENPVQDSPPPVEETPATPPAPTPTPPPAKSAPAKATPAKATGAARNNS